MNKEKLRIKIAERCGWEALEASGPFGKPCVRNVKAGIDWILCPNYLEDLNAIRDAVMSQPQDVRLKINQMLLDMMNPSEAHLLDRTINAPADKRCEAFARALGFYGECL